MARCGGCNETCTCKVVQGANITVTGSGSAADPYVVAGNAAAAGVPFTVTDTSTVDLTVNPADPQNLSAVVKVSPDAGNTLVANANGLYVPDIDTPTAVTVLDTPSLDLTLTGTGTPADPYVISGVAAPTVVTAGPNITVTGAGTVANPYVVTGVDVDTPTVVTAGTNVTVTGTGTPADPYVVNAAAGGASTTISPLDTTTFDSVITGPAGGPYVVGGNVIISPDAGNTLVANPNGLFVPDIDTPTVIQALDTPCIDTTVTGAGTLASPFIVSSAPVIAPEPNGLECGPTGLTVPPSSDAGNTLTIGTDGRLFTPPPGAAAATVINVLDTNCIDMTITGAGTVASPFVLSSAPKLDPLATNLLTCGAAGLLARTPSINVLDTTCINSTITGTGTVADPFILSAVPVISPTAGNTLTCTPTGLFVPAGAITPGCGIKVVGGVTQANVAALPLSPLINEAGGGPAPFACPVGSYADVVCDPATGQLHAPPEHTSIEGVVTGGSGGQVPVLISLFARAQSINVNIANPSPCRGMNVLVTIRTEVRLANIPDTAGYVVNTEENGNSGTFPAPGGINPQPLEAVSIQTDNGVRVRAGMTYQLIEHTTFYIPPGGTYNFITFIDVSPRGAAGGQVIAAAQRAHFLGVTI